MKKRSIKIILLLTSLIIISKVLNSFFEKKYVKNYSNILFGSLNYYLDSVKCNNLFIGSSKILHGVNPKIVNNNSYNLSIESTHFIVHAGIINILESKNKLPKRIFLNIEPYEFENNNQYQKEINRLKFHYYENDFIRKQINKISTYEFLKFLIPTYRFNGFVNDIFSQKDFKINDRIPNKGYLPVSTKFEDNTRLYYDLKKIDLSVKLKFNNSNTIHILNQLIKLCKKNKVELIILTTPNYLLGNNSINNSEALEKYLETKNVKYYNFFKTKIPAFKQKEFWHDNIHLKDSGATIYSLELKRKIEELDSISLLKIN